MTPTYWVRVGTLVLMLLYTVAIGALAAQVPGFALPPVWVYFLTVLSPVVLLAAHALPSVLTPTSADIVPEPTILPKP